MQKGASLSPERGEIYRARECVQVMKRAVCLPEVYTRKNTFCIVCTSIIPRPTIWNLMPRPATSSTRALSPPSPHGKTRKSCETEEPGGVYAKAPERKCVIWNPLCYPHSCDRCCCPFLHVAVSRRYSRRCLTYRYISERPF